MSEKRTHLFYEFRSAGGAVALRPKSRRSPSLYRSEIEAAARILRSEIEIFRVRFEITSCPLASILNRGEIFLSHVRPEGRTTSEPRENRRPVTGSGSVLILYLQLFCSQSCRNTRASSIKQPSSTLTFTTSPGTPRSTV